MSHLSKNPVRGKITGGGTPTAASIINDEIRSLPEPDFNKLFKLAERLLKEDEQERFLLYLMDLRFGVPAETVHIKKKHLVKKIVAALPTEKNPAISKHFTFPVMKDDIDAQMVSLFHLLKDQYASIATG